MRSPLELQSFVSWLEKQPPREKYDYEKWEGCALAAYARALGMEPWSLYRITGCSKMLSKPGYRDLFDISVRKPWTFGAAARRGKKILRGNKLPIGSDEA